MKKAYVLVEGPNEVAFLKKVLSPDAQSGVHFVEEEGESNITSLARSLLVSRRVPVAVFMDAHSLEPYVIKERRKGMEEMIKFSTAPLPVKVVVAVPELEACFFAVPEVIERVLGVKVPTDLIPLGLRDPKGVLAYLEAGKQPKWDTLRAIAEMDAHDVERVRATAPVQELTTFLQSLPQPEPVELSANPVGT